MDGWLTQYSPLWLDPASLPPQHALYQATYVRENERGADDALDLLEYALAEGTRPASDDGRGGQERSGVSEASAASAAADDPRTSPPGDARAQRRLDAERFCALPAAARLELTHAQLRHAYAYCVHCGHRYATCDELDAECPGEAEDAHG